MNLTGRRTVLLAVVFLLLLGAVQVAVRLLTIDPESKQASALLGTWRPTSITGFPLAGAPADRATITFNADSHWRSSDGCNALGGKFEATATKFSAYDFGPQTVIGCNNVPTTTVLEQAAHWKVTSTALTFYTKSSALLATYAR